MLQVSGLDSQQEDLQPPSSPSEPHHSHLSQHYREHPSQNHDISSEDDLDDQDDPTGSEGTASDEEADPSTWLADPPPGKLNSAQSCSPHTLR